MDDPTLDADLEHHLFRTNSRGSRPFTPAAYNKGGLNIAAYSRDFDTVLHDFYFGFSENTSSAGHHLLQVIYYKCR